MKRRVYMRWPDGHFGYLYVSDDDKLQLGNDEVTVEQINATHGVAVAHDPALNQRLRKLGLVIEDGKNTVKITSFSVTEENIRGIRENLHDLQVLYPMDTVFRSASSVTNVLLGAVNDDPETFGKLIHTTNKSPEEVLTEAFRAQLKVEEELAKERHSKGKKTAK